jgi:hypothetical protein
VSLDRIWKGVNVYGNKCTSAFLNLFLEMKSQFWKGIISKLIGKIVGRESQFNLKKGNAMFSYFNGWLSKRDGFSLLVAG